MLNLLANITVRPIAGGEWAQFLTLVDDRAREECEAMSGSRRPVPIGALAPDNTFGLAVGFQQPHRKLRDLFARPNVRALYPALWSPRSPRSLRNPARFALCHIRPPCSSPAAGIAHDC